jgi:hypothetical protein
MFYDYLRRGALAGLVGGVSFGGYTAFVVQPLITAVESEGHDHAGAAAGGVELAVATSALTSVAASVALGLLFGIGVFGVVYFFLEPAVPGRDGVKSYVLGGAGFLSVSGAPWLVLPPLPPGVERAVPADLGLLLYAAMVLVGAATVGVAAFAWKRIDGPAQFPVIVAAFVPLVALGIVASPVPTTGSTPPALAAAFRATVVTGQLVLWGLMAGTHATLSERSATPVGHTDVEPSRSG